MRQNQWYFAALDGLAKAAIRFRDQRWLVALWDFFEDVDREQPFEGSQPAGYFRTLMSDIGKALSPEQQFNIRISKDANKGDGFSFWRFQDRWGRVYREWPRATTMGLLRRLRAINDRQVYMSLERDEILGVTFVLELLPIRAKPDTFREILACPFGRKDCPFQFSWKKVLARLRERKRSK
jgi:hypothetical protein